MHLTRGMLKANLGAGGVGVRGVGRSRTPNPFAAPWRPRQPLSPHRPRSSQLCAPPSSGRSDLPSTSGSGGEPAAEALSSRITGAAAAQQVMRASDALVSVDHKGVCGLGGPRLRLVVKAGIPCAIASEELAGGDSESLFLRRIRACSSSCVSRNHVCVTVCSQARACACVGTGSSLPSEAHRRDLRWPPSAGVARLPSARGAVPVLQPVAALQKTAFQDSAAPRASSGMGPPMMPCAGSSQCLPARAAGPRTEIMMIRLRLAGADASDGRPAMPPGRGRHGGSGSVRTDFRARQ
jgi:hypothetical protein